MVYVHMVREVNDVFQPRRVIFKNHKLKCSIAFLQRMCLKTSTPENEIHLIHFRPVAQMREKFKSNFHMNGNENVRKGHKSFPIKTFFQ